MLKQGGCSNLELESACPWCVGHFAFCMDGCETASFGSAALNHTAVGQPEWRSAFLAEAIRHTAHIAGPISPFALFRHLQDWLGLSEEVCGGEINTILFAMVRSGLYTSNTHDVATGTITLGAETRLTASRVLTVCLHGEPSADPEDDDI